MIPRIAQSAGISEEQVRVVLEAVREPTEAVADAGMCAPRSERTREAKNSLDRQAGAVTDIWQAMIDALLANGRDG